MTQPVIPSAVIELDERAHREYRLARVLIDDAGTIDIPESLAVRIARHRANAAEYQRRLKEITG